MAGEQPMIAVEGLSGLIGALRSLGAEVWPAARRELVIGAEQAASYAIFIAHQKGLYDSGELIDKIKAGWRGFYAYITDVATRVSKSFPAGFNYPAIYEYGGSQTRRAHGADWMIRNRSSIGVSLIAKYGLGVGHTGPRAFLWPAAIAGEEELYHSFELLFDRLARDAGLEPLTSAA